MDSKLLIEIHNKHDVSLTLLTTSLLSLAGQFSRFLDRHGIESNKNIDSLYVKNIKSGSIIIELAPCLAYALPLLQDFNTVFEFTSYLQKSFNYFLGKDQEKTIKHDKKDLYQLSECLNVVANDSGSTMSFIALPGGKQEINLAINYMEANAIQNKTRKEIDNMGEEKHSKYTKQLLTWYQTRFDKDCKTGDMGIIDNISKKPTKVIFENDQIKYEIINTTGFSKRWHSLAYLVDVEVLYINDVPKRYKITNFYPEETFDPEDES